MRHQNEAETLPPGVWLRFAFLPRPQRGAVHTNHVNTSGRMNERA
jgi:hypothetical protein